MSPQEQFAQKLKAARTKAGISQEALALKIGIHRTEIGRLERATRDPRLSTIIKIAQGLEIDPAELVAGLTV